MSDEIQAPAEPGTPDAAVVGAPPVEVAPAAAAQAPAPVAPEAPAEPSDSADAPAPEPETLPTVREAEAETDLARREQSIEDDRRALDVAPLSTDRHTVGLRQSDTVMVLAPKLGDEGQRQEQIHTNL